MFYVASLHGGFVFEDSQRDARPWHDVSAPERSLHRLSVALTGHDPTLARALSLAVHILNGFLVFLLANRVASAGAAGLAAGFFLLHPLQTESVAYVSARPELLATFWVLLACVASSRSLWLAWLCAGLAVTGKEFGVMAWALVPLFAWWTGQRWSDAWRVTWAVSGAVMVGLFLRSSILYLGNLDYLAALGLHYTAIQLTSLWRLLALLPESLWSSTALSIDHGWGWITRPAAYSGVLAWLAVLGVAYRLRWPAWGLAAAWTLVALLPRLVLPFPDGLHERHLSTAMVGISLAFGLTLAPKGS